MASPPDGSEPPAALPGATPHFVSPSESTTYANLTIDDFSPLLSFIPPLQETGGTWVSPLTDNLSAVDPIDPRPWHLGTYRRTTRRDASFTLTFYGSEVHLYGGTGPDYGAFAIQVDGGEREVQSAHHPALVIGPAVWMGGVTGLDEGKHELTVTVLGQREGMTEGSGFLLDYVIVRQQVGPVGGDAEPAIKDIVNAGLEEGIKNRTGEWRVWNITGDVITAEGEDAKQPKWFMSSDERGASFTHSFSNATAVQIFGTRNATHGLYRTTLTSPSSSLNVSETHNATAPCDFTGPGTENVLPGCEWRGSVLKYAAAGLDPTLPYQLTVENIDEDGGAFEVSLLRTFGVEGVKMEPGSFAGESGNAGVDDNENGGGDGENGVLGRGVGVNEFVLMGLAWVVLGRTLLGFGRRWL